MAKIFFSPSKNHEIYDQSEAFDLETLPEHLKSDDYQSITLLPGEGQKYEDGILTKINLVQENEKKMSEERTALEQLIDRAETTDDLKAILKERLL